MVTAISIDHELLHDSFRAWQAEQTLLDAQLSESVQALEAYQSHLDVWQQELAREREELRQQKLSYEREQAESQDKDQIVQLNRELEAARQQVNTLTAALASQHQTFETQRHEWEQEAARLREAIERAAKTPAVAEARYTQATNTIGPAKAEPRSASPVLGSVMEQFGKLRQQRSMSRPNSKPR